MKMNTFTAALLACVGALVLAASLHAQATVTITLVRWPFT
jgi:hypothetical protein